jgi:hypothetical protein
MIVRHNNKNDRNTKYDNTSGLFFFKSRNSVPPLMTVHHVSLSEIKLLRIMPIFVNQNESGILFDVHGKSMSPCENNSQIYVSCLMKTKLLRINSPQLICCSDRTSFSPKFLLVLLYLPGISKILALQAESHFYLLATCVKCKPYSIRCRTICVFLTDI